jgi:hypothetical protein
MTATTDTVRNQGFMPFESDIPAGVTLAEWRASRPRQARVSRLPLRRRLRVPRRAAAA